MGDYKLLTAVIDEKCSLCFTIIKHGDKFYFEVEEKKIFCLECGRCIRKYGEREAFKKRDFVGDFGRMFEAAFGVRPPEWP